MIRKPNHAKVGDNRRLSSEAERAGVYYLKDRGIGYCRAGAKRRVRPFHQVAESWRLARNRDPAKTIGKQACIIRWLIARQENSSSDSGKI